MNQYIVFCLQDSDPYEAPENNWLYVQASRRRFTKKQVENYIKQIAPSRRPVMVKVPSVEINKDGYPVEKR